jgi:transposase
MDKLIERCAGLDVHKKTVAACVRVPGSDGERRQETRTFSTMTDGLLALRDWLCAHGVRVVGMESTGAYWKPVDYLLEDELECWLLNAHHLRNVPGRKTDVSDAAWICQLVEHGLVRPSFVPPRPIRQLRDLTCYRKVVIQERTRQAQRLSRPVAAGRSNAPTPGATSTASCAGAPSGAGWSSSSGWRWPSPIVCGRLVRRAWTSDR